MAHPNKLHIGFVKAGKAKAGKAKAGKAGGSFKLLQQKIRKKN